MNKKQKLKIILEAIRLIQLDLQHYSCMALLYSSPNPIFGQKIRKEYETFFKECNNLDPLFRDVFWLKSQAPEFYRDFLHYQNLKQFRLTLLTMFYEFVRTDTTV